MKFENKLSTMKKIIIAVTLSVLYGCNQSENTEAKTLTLTPLMEEASNLLVTKIVKTMHFSAFCF